MTAAVFANHLTRAVQQAMEALRERDGMALVQSQSFGWGRDGHQVIANPAQSRLSPASPQPTGGV